jgi:hypothetical protein
MDVPFQRFVCVYNETTYLCNVSTRIVDTRTYCATNATNLTDYLDSTTYTSSEVFTPGIIPCVPECPVSNTTGAPSPSPTPASAGPTPSVACTYTEWGSWSSECLEYPTGTFSQVRTRQPDEAGVGCDDTQQRQNCSTASCLTWNTTSFGIECDYNLETGLCNSSTYISTTQAICSTNATNLTLYQELVPGDEPYVVETGPSQPCSEFCPPTTPLPCDYSAWSAWSESCFEYGGTYFQQQTRALLTYNASCLDDLVQQSDCDLRVCTNNVLVLRDPGCDDYDSATGDCLSSSATTTFLTVCATNATDLDTYYALPQWTREEVTAERITPCDPSCPANNGAVTPVPVPVPTPTSGSCLYSGWTAWSFQCAEVQLEEYQQYRTRDALEPSSECQDEVAYQDCDVQTCQTVTYYYGIAECTYDESETCDTGSLDTVIRRFCLTNATLLGNYLETAPYEQTSVNTTSGPCPSICPLDGPEGTLIVTERLSDDGGISVFLTNFLDCLPPFYTDPLTLECEECTNTSVCTVGQLDPEQRTCTQVPRCNDGDRCTSDTCDANTGECRYSPLQGVNLYNASVQCICFPGTEGGQDPFVMCALVQGPAVPMPGINCGETNASFVCGYRESTQRCQCLALDTVPLSPTVSAGPCEAEEVSLPNGTSVVPQYLFGDNYWVCPSDDGLLTVCVDGACEDPYTSPTINETYCGYDILVFNAEQGTVQTVAARDDSLCPVPDPETTGKNYSLCMPSLCAHSLTGCAQCASFVSQVHLQYPLGCDCCSTYLDCEEGYTCLSTPGGNRCRPNSEAPLGVCLDDADCVSPNLCRTTACNSTLRQCYFATNTECAQLENVCTATYQCEPETGDCVRVATTCNDDNLCTEDFCQVVDGQPSCFYVEIIPIYPPGECLVESCNATTGWSMIPRPCPTGRTCVQSQGCQLDCTTDSECDYLDDPFICTQGLCVDNVCMARTTCTFSQRCSSGSCIDAGCSEFPICADGQIRNTANPPTCPCVCDPATCAQLEPPGPCYYYGCSANGSTCEPQEVSCDDGTDCTSNPTCDPETGTCPQPIALCPNIAIGCPTALVCANNEQCVEVNTTTCPTCPNTTMSTCDNGDLTYFFVCDDGDPCTADSVDPVTGGCRHDRDPDCCTKNTQCPSGSCSLEFNACNPPISGCVSGDYTPCTRDAQCPESERCWQFFCRPHCYTVNPCVDSAYEYLCIDGTCQAFSFGPLSNPSCVVDICGTTTQDWSRCNDNDFTTADFCDPTICPDSPQQCAHCTYENDDNDRYSTFIFFDQCTCT